jgi:hypothetical protein
MGPMPGCCVIGITATVYPPFNDTWGRRASLKADISFRSTTEAHDWVKAECPATKPKRKTGINHNAFEKERRRGKPEARI